MELLLTLYAMLVLQINSSPVPAALQQLKKKPNPKYAEFMPSLDKVRSSFLRGENNWGSLPAELAAYTKHYSSDKDSLQSIAALLKAFVSFISRGNENAFKRLEKTAAASVFPVWISQNFLTKSINQDPINKQLTVLVKRMTGRNDTTFSSLDEAAAAKSKFPKVYHQWQQLRKEHRASWQASLAAFVRESGNKTVPYPALMKFFAKQGIEHTMPTGFTGNIDAAGKWYSPFDELMTGVPSTAVFPKVRMNPNYKKGSTEYVCVAIRADGSEGGYVYTEATKKANSVKKFQKVEDFSHIIKAVRSKWVQLIMKGDPEEPRTVAAVVLELLFMFSARVGSRPAEHNGISSLTVAHITLQDSGFILKYLGKDKVPTRHVFKVTDKLTQRIFEIVKILATAPDKKRKDFLFTYRLRRGNFKQVVAGVVTKVFRLCGAGSLSVHKLRTYHATELMKGLLDKVYANRTNFKNTKEAFELLKKLAMKVGKDLNHVRRNSVGETVITPNTALANYIDVSIQVAFFQHYSLPVPKYLEKYVANPSALMSTSLNVFAAENPTDDELQEQTQAEEDSRNKEESDRESDLDLDDKIARERREKEATRIGEILTRGGDSPGNYAPEDQSFDNVLL